MPKVTSFINLKGQFVALFLALFFFAGCLTLDVPEKPSSMWKPPQWYIQSQKPETILSAAKGTKPSTDQPMKLIELIDLGLRNNPSTRQAWQTALVAQAQLGSAKSAWYPTVKLDQNFDYTRNIANYEVNKLGQGDIGLNMQMTYLLFDFGGRSAKVEQAFQMLLASNFQFNQTIQDLLLQIATAYFNFYSATALHEATDMDVKDAKGTLDATQQKFEAGTQAKLDVLEANSNYQKALYQLESAFGDVKTAEGELAKALGFPAGTPLNIMSPQKDVEFKVGEKTVSQLIEEGLDKRPDIAVERASLAAKIAAIKAAKSDLWPTLNAKGNGANDWYRNFGLSGGLPPGSEHNYGYTAGVSVDWPLFEGFDTVSKIKAAEADAKAEFEQLRQKEIGATADIWEKYYNFVTATRKLDFSKAYVESSQGSYNLALEGYKSGLKNIIDLLHAEADLSDARSQLITSRRDLYLAFAQLVHATGTINERTDAARAQPGGTVHL